MKFTLSGILFLMFCAFLNGQSIENEWYGETANNGIIIQNSLPKGGSYTGTTDKNFNYSRLVFVTRVINETETPFELTVDFSADSFEIPNSPDTFVQLFLPSETMTIEKLNLFNYGLADSHSFDKPSSFQKTIDPEEDCLFYVVAMFYQTKANPPDQSRGGNRAEFVLKGQDLFYRMPPQIGSLPCGRIVFSK